MRKKLRTIKILLLVIIIIGGGFGYYYSHYIAPNNYTVKKPLLTIVTFLKNLKTLK